MTHYGKDLKTFTVNTWVFPFTYEDKHFNNGLCMYSIGIKFIYSNDPHLLWQHNNNLISTGIPVGTLLTKGLKLFINELLRLTAWKCNPTGITYAMCVLPRLNHRLRCYVWNGLEASTVSLARPSGTNERSRPPTHEYARRPGRQCRTGSRGIWAAVRRAAAIPTCLVRLRRLSGRLVTAVIGFFAWSIWVEVISRLSAVTKAIYCKLTYLRVTCNGSSKLVANSFVCNVFVVIITLEFHTRQCTQYIILLVPSSAICSVTKI